jgi:hypothetical protein
LAIKGAIGRIIEKPIISINTAIQRGDKVGYTNNLRLLLVFSFDIEILMHLITMIANPN